MIAKANKLKNSNLLHIQDVYKEYDDNVILDNIDLSVSKGAFVTVVAHLDVVNLHCCD